MNLVDTHCHLTHPDYKEDLKDVLKRAKEKGISRIIVPGTNIEDSIKAVRLAAKNSMIFAAVGIHPHDADSSGKKEIDDLRDIALRNDKVVAIGEIGLDLYRNYSKLINQQKLLTKSLNIASHLDLPVILHNRSADKELVKILEKFAARSLKGVCHCFSSDRALVNELLEMGLYISFAGNITFRKAGELRSIIKHVPPEKLLLETDGPYISPEPFRGKRNEPANIVRLLDVYSEVYGLSREDIARITTHNANELFSLGIKEDAAIVYPIRDSLYINVTNRCTNRCVFCTRKYSNFVKGHNLLLQTEPTAREIISELKGISKYKEIVFCGFGEPTLRLETVIKVASFAKKKKCKVRLTTNGEGNLINGFSIAEKLKGVLDKVSVSVNASGEKEYARLCNPCFGSAARGGISNFIKECVTQGIEVEVTCLDLIGEEGISECRKEAEGAGAKFRLRHLNKVG
ncbi:MAG: YchF/TatD family DNA exonuclease [Candidatus Omnitrophica bacterium]|nr:YchF/TatD family DNA exonuclease [Candidatus Omnitrophota bacterium]